MIPCIRMSNRPADRGALSEIASCAGFGKVLDDAKGGLLDDERIFLFDASDLLGVCSLLAFHLSMSKYSRIDVLVQCII